MRYPFGDYVLDTGLYRLERQGEAVRLPPRVFKMLVYLLEQRHRVVGRQELFEQVWPGQFVSDAALESCIKQVRQAVGDSGRLQHVIQTVHGHGYRFVAAVSDAGAAATAAAPEAFIPSSDIFQASPSESPSATSTVATVSAVPPTVPVAATPAAPLFPEPERRQLTVLSCALAEADMLTHRLDPDDLHEVLLAFHALGTEITRQYGGYVAQRTEDGIGVYFGYPQAHDDDARRAVLAGLQLADAVRSRLAAVRLLPEFPLAVRIGIHSGPVVVWVDASDVQPTVLAAGPTSAIATALRELAAPRGVVISESTAALVQGYFSWQALMPYQPDGQREALAVYQVMGESQAQIRLDLTAPGRQTPFVGRESELALLEERWVQVAVSQGQAVVVHGEAGIGKSRLVRTLAEHLPAGTCTVLEGRGSPYHQQSAFYPLRHLLQQVFHLDDRTGADTAIGQAEAVLQEVSLGAQQHLPFLAPLLDLSLPESRYVPQSLSPQQRRQRTLASLTELFIAMSDLQPVLLVLEDLHWVDPSTLEWLGLLLDQVPTHRLMVLLTSRPEFDRPWSSRSYLTQLTLNRLTSSQIQRMVASVVGDRLLPTAVIEQIVAHSDGVPLFIEELTRSVLDSGTTTTIPTTLHDVLMARLDQVGEARRTAQLGAVMGRQFSYALLDAVSSLDATVLQQDLRCLVEMELLYQRGVGNDATYLFKHALIQDTAYQSLLRRTQQHHHRRIAQVLESQFPESKATQPEVLAHHYTEAGLPEQAILYWQQAGEQAVKRSANVEAVAHLRSGIALLKTWPDTAARVLQELTLQRALGVPLLAIKGYASPEVEAVYSRARALCRQVGDTPHIFPVLYGLRGFYQTRGDLQTAREIAEELLTLAERQQDPAFILQGHRALGDVLHFLGEFTASRVHLEQGIALYDPDKHHSHAFVYGGDPGVGCHANLAYILAQLGYLDQALHHCQKAVSLARGLPHVFSLAIALNVAVNFHYARKQWQLLQERAEELIALATEHGFAQPLANATTIQGFALVRQGQIEAGMRQVQQGLTAFYATGAVLSRASRFRQLADIYYLLGQVEEGLTCIDEAMADARRSGERHTESDRYRLKGVLLLAQSADNQTAAEACLRQAIKVAQSQRSKLSELRAATSLARLWQSQGRRQKAYDLLTPVYAWFTEGFDTADLQEAKTLLEELTD